MSSNFVPARLKFWSTRIASGREFAAFRKDAQESFDTRWLFEQSLATREDRLLLDGTCALCVAPTAFTSLTEGGEGLADGRRVPNWREEQKCACPSALNSRQRAVLHFLQARIGLGDWSRVLVLGPPESLAEPLEARAGTVRLVPRLDIGLDALRPYRLPERDETQHAVLALEYLHRVPPLTSALGEILRVLTPGGYLMFTVPFRVDALETKSFVNHLPTTRRHLPPEFGGEVHEIGWDILDKLRETGFSEASAHLYWSEELGYLGPYNFVFAACK